MNEQQPMQPVINVASLCKRYYGQEQAALDSVDLQVQQGEFFGLLGPNGAGKTTLISILCGLLPQDSGTAEILGSTYRHQPAQIKRNIGIVPQEIALYDRLSARENLQFFGRLLGLSGSRLTDRIASCLHIAQLQDRADQPVGGYSGGMKRRLNLVIGLLGEPQILFLDEPTVGVDTQSRHLIHTELARLHREGVTLIYTTHYMEEAQELCSRVAILDSGRILLEGEPQQLLAHGHHASLEELFLSLTGKHLRDT